MPAFGQVLTEAAIHRVIDYLRGFCPSQSWPRGELNLPRSLVTEKAFPENESVLSFSIGGGEWAAIGSELIYERRFGARSQLELAVPIETEKNGQGGWRRGVGDVAIGVKHALYHNLNKRTIVSVAGEARLPTGNHSRGLEQGVAIFEPFVAVGHVLPADGFLQWQSGVELPADPAKANKEAFVRAALGKSFMSGRFGRTWSPIVELTGARELARATTDDDGPESRWSLIPQLQVTLSKRQHVLVNGGIRLPLTNRGEHKAQLLTYLLWDWADGGLFDGW